MMVTTHALWGMVLALPVLAVSPDLAPVAFAAGFVGGLAPDLDLYTGHRKTLHYPVYASIATVPALVLLLLTPSTWTVALAVGLAAAALHAVTDVFGGGLELRPWQRASERAVYSHYHGRWISPRRWIRYDGAPEDLVFGSLAAGLLAAIGSGAVSAVVVTLVAVSVVYALLRKSLANLAERLVGLVPDPVLSYLPARYREA